MQKISEVVKCAKDIEETTRPLLERLRSGIFRRQAKVATPSAIVNKPMEIQDSNKEDEEGVGAIWIILEVVTKVGQITKNPQLTMQPQMEKQQLMIPSSFQLGLANFCTK